jgi:HK97 family phage major capsid protein
MRLKEIRERQQVLVAEARERLDQIDTATDAARAAELEAAHDVAMAEHDKLEERAVKLEKLAALEEARDAPDPRRPTGEAVRVAPATTETADEAYSRVFRSFMMNGADSLPREERALLRRFKETDRENRAGPQGVTSSPAGGYLVPQGFMAELVVSMKAFGPMLNPGVTRELTTDTGAPLPWPTMDDTSNTGRRIAENVQVTTAGITMGAKMLNAWKYTTDAILVAEELTQDSGIAVEGIVRDAMAERLGRIVNLELTTGTGQNMPMGIVTAAGAGATAGGSNAITFDDIIELQHAVDPAYRESPNVKWMFHDLTLKALRKLKNGDGDYIWQPASVVAAAPATIADHPYAINQAMPLIGTGNTSVVFGDFSKYVVRRVREFALKRLVERYADFDQIGFIGFGRYDGNLMDAGAVRALAHP